jgi:putative ubiquitin-RnfH superfamily antitoxin RatB of RatAB toxin-antitoxin module
VRGSSSADGGTPAPREPPAADGAAGAPGAAAGGTLCIDVVDARLSPHPRSWRGRLAAGASVADALRAAGVDATDIDREGAAVGVWGRVTGMQHRLVDGDRVEVYAGPRIDPRAVRAARLPRR